MDRPHVKNELLNGEMSRHKVDGSDHGKPHKEELYKMAKKPEHEDHSFRLLIQRTAVICQVTVEGEGVMKLLVGEGVEAAKIDRIPTVLHRKGVEPVLHKPIELHLALFAREGE